MAVVNFCNSLIGELDAIYRFAYQFCDQPGQVDELVAETYRRVFSRGTVLQNTALNSRLLLLKVLHEVAFSGKTALHDEIFEPENAHRSYLAASTDDDLARSLQSLPLPLRAVFLLCSVEKLTYHQIADITDLPFVMIVRRLHRAHMRLAATLGAQGSINATGRKWASEL